MERRSFLSVIRLGRGPRKQGSSLQTANRGTSSECWVSASTPTMSWSGAPGYNHSGVSGRKYDQGSAFVYSRNSIGQWTLEDQLVASDGFEGQYFGVATAIDGDTILVGSQNNQSRDGGAAYIYRRDAARNWKQEAKLGRGETPESDKFGHSLDLAGDIAVVGASHALEGRGVLHVFQRVGVDWAEKFRLLATDGEPNDFLGTTPYGVGVWENTVIGGARGIGVDNAGLVYAIRIVSIRPVEESRNRLSTV